jgi:hypothetical protein
VLKSGHTNDPSERSIHSGSLACTSRNAIQSLGLVPPRNEIERPTLREFDPFGTLDTWRLSSTSQRFASTRLLCVHLNP